MWARLDARTAAGRRAPAARRAVAAAARWASVENGSKRAVAVIVGQAGIGLGLRYKTDMFLH
jgi:hypothetical protein